jgi:hypothetical protein
MNSLKGIPSCTGRSITFSVITNIYNQKNQRTYRNGIVHSHRKTEKVIIFFENYICSMCASRVTRNTSIRCSSSCHTRIKMGASIIFTAAINHPFSSARSRGNGGTNTRYLTYPPPKKNQRAKCTLHSNHRLTRVIFHHTKRLLTWERPFSHYIHSHCLAAEMWTTIKKNNLLGEGEREFELFLLSVQVL